MVPDNKSENVPVTAPDRCLEEGHVKGPILIRKIVMPHGRAQFMAVGQLGQTMVDAELKDVKKDTV